MASDFIALDVRGLPELQEILRRLTPEVQDAVIDEVSKYLINVLRQYPPKKSVTRAQAYGQTFFSDKQRKWFFAALNKGELHIPYRRTQTLSRGWKQIGSGAKSILANETPYAALVMGVGEQSRHAIAIGWKNLDEITQERGEEIERRAEVGAKKGVKKAGA